MRPLRSLIPFSKTIFLFGYRIPLVDFHISLSGLELRIVVNLKFLSFSDNLRVEISSRFGIVGNEICAETGTS